MLHVMAESFDCLQIDDHEAYVETQNGTMNVKMNFAKSTP